jgi:hypothetical protein
MHKHMVVCDGLYMTFSQLSGALTCIHRRRTSAKLAACPAPALLDLSACRIGLRQLLNMMCTDTSVQLRLGPDSLVHSHTVPVYAHLHGRASARPGVHNHPPAAGMKQCLQCARCAGRAKVLVPAVAKTIPRSDVSARALHTVHLYGMRQVSTS